MAFKSKGDQFNSSRDGGDKPASEPPQVQQFGDVLLIDLEIEGDDSFPPHGGQKCAQDQASITSEKGKGGSASELARPGGQKSAWMGPESTQRNTAVYLARKKESHGVQGPDNMGEKKTKSVHEKWIPAPRTDTGSNQNLLVPIPWSLTYSVRALLVFRYFQSIKGC